MTQAAMGRDPLQAGSPLRTPRAPRSRRQCPRPQRAVEHHMAQGIDVTVSVAMDVHRDPVHAERHPGPASAPSGSLISCRAGSGLSAVGQFSTGAASDTVRLSLASRKAASTPPGVMSFSAPRLSSEPQGTWPRSRSHTWNGTRPRSSAGPEKLPRWCRRGYGSCHQPPFFCKSGGAATARRVARRQTARESSCEPSGRLRSCD